MEGPVTIQLVVACAVVASTVVGIALWAVFTFQTKAEARSEREDVHRHLNAMRAESKEEIRIVQSEVSAMRTEYSGIAKDISYIKGRLEPKP